VILLSLSLSGNFSLSPKFPLSEKAQQVLSPKVCVSTYVDRSSA